VYEQKLKAVGTIITENALKIFSAPQQFPTLAKQRNPKISKKNLIIEK